MKHSGRLLLMGGFILLVVQGLMGQSVTWQQYFYVASKIFPDSKVINVLLPEEEESVQKPAIARAATLFKLKVKIFLVRDTRSIGTNFKLIPENSIVVVYNAPIVNEKNTMLYILTQAKEKKLALITTNRSYSEAGALVGLLRDEKGHLRVYVNLKYSPGLAAKFTPEFNQKIGVARVLQ